MPKLRTFLHLDGRDRLASLEAMVALVVAAGLVRLAPPRRWRRRFGTIARPATFSPEDPANLAAIRRVRRAVARGERNIPANANCLPQALAARWMLERRGIASTLYLGSERGDGGINRFHAWLKVGPEWVTGHCDESRYSLLVPTGPEAA